MIKKKDKIQIIYIYFLKLPQNYDRSLTKIYHLKIFILTERVIMFRYPTVCFWWSRTFNSAFLRVCSSQTRKYPRESHIPPLRRGKEEEWCPIHQNCMSVAISTLPPARGTESTRGFVYLTRARICSRAYRYSMRTLYPLVWAFCLRFSDVLFRQTLPFF